MKKIAYLFFGIALLFSACKDDRSLEFALRYDSNNATAPFLIADFYEAAARFPASITKDYVGKQLTQVSYFMTGTPLQTSLKIYSGGSEASPGTVVYEAELTGNITENAFNAHVLTTPLDINGEDLWLSIRFRLNREIQTIGCDPGPAAENGDWLFQESDGQWQTFRQRSGESINWNIRGVVSE